MTQPCQFAYALNGDRRGEKLSGTDIENLLEADTLCWAHLDAADPETQDWVSMKLSYLDHTVTDALTQTETRQRANIIGNSLLVILRGVNTNEGMDREDMVAVRCWADEHRIVTLSRQRVRALEDIAKEVALGEGPDTAGAFLSLLAERLNARFVPFVRDLDQSVEALETEVIDSPRSELRRTIVGLRLSVVELRRHAPPQRDAVNDLLESGSPLLSDQDLRELHEAHDKLVRLAENLDELRDNLSVLRDELQGQLSDRLNRHMYLISIMSGVFLPLGFLTGLLGINVGGIPGAGDPHAFWVFSAILIGILCIQVVVLRVFRWMN
jgi:zinc transporter